MNSLIDKMAIASEDFIWSTDINPSCQKGVMDKCRCMDCCRDRLDAALDEYRKQKEAPRCKNCGGEMPHETVKYGRDCHFICVPGKVSAYQESMEGKQNGK